MWRMSSEIIYLTLMLLSLYSASEKFLDGGLVGNNPILDTLAEIEEWNMAVRAKGRESEVFTPTVVVSLGCGKPPVMLVSTLLGGCAGPCL